jgi:hypothetical protein
MALVFVLNKSGHRRVDSSLHPEGLLEGIVNSMSYVETSFAVRRRGRHQKWD